LIASDGNQSTVNRQKFTWKSVGVKAVGRSKKLTQNYRNTQEILAAAWSIVRSLSVTSNVEDSELTFPVVEPQAALRHGSLPVLYQSSSKMQCVDAVAQQVQQLCESGYAPGEIAIIYRRKPSEAQIFQSLMDCLSSLGLRLYWVTENTETKRSYSVKVPGIRIITALSSLGLEFKAVLIPWVEQFEDCHSSDLEKATLERRQLYVAMTRAQDELHLFSSGRSRIANELENSQAFKVVSLFTSPKPRIKAVAH
jgi:superfamily I DNA/RNA helicase